MTLSIGKYTSITLACAFCLVLILDVRFSSTPQFYFDGCSRFPDTVLGIEYTHCCKIHDRTYYTGGTQQERQESDQLLKQCVYDAGLPITAQIMYLGVRFGGTPYLPMRYRWGFKESYGIFIIKLNNKLLIF